MTNLLKLQFRKSLMTFSVIAAALLASAPLALLIKPAAMKSAEAVKLAMLYWELAGIPLVALILSGIAGSEAAREQAALTEQPLPVSQYRLLLSSLLVALLETAALTLAAWAIMGAQLPLESLTKMQEFMYRFYIFALVYLSLYGFTLSYAFGNGIAGAALAGTAVVSTLLPLISMSVFQKLAFELIPLWLLIPAIAVLALAAGALALKPLSGIADRKVKRTPANMSAVVLLLAGPVLFSFAALAWLNLEARKVTLPVRYMFSRLYGADKYIGGARAREAASGLMLVQKPFYGEVFLIDKAGNRSVIDTGGETRAPGFTYLMPDLSFASGETVTGPSGETWVFYMRRDRGVILSGSMKAGFTVRAEVGDAWSMNLLGGKEPGVLHRREDGYYFAALPPQKGGLEWKKVSSIGEGYMSFLNKRYLKDGIAAVFRKDGETLEYRGKSWTVPGALVTVRPVPGIELADGMNFIVPAKTKNGYATWLCPPGGKPEIIWPDFFGNIHNLSITSDGAAWGVKRSIATAPGRKKIKFAEQEFNILTPEGRAFSGIKLDDIPLMAGYSDDALTPLRARDGWLWFSAGDKYLVKIAAGNQHDFKVWRLPEVVRDRVNLVSAAAEGIFIAAADGVYFMDWAGASKKIY